MGLFSKKNTGASATQSQPTRIGAQSPPSPKEQIPSLDRKSTSLNNGSGQVSDEAKRRAAISLRLSATFVQIVTVLMRSPVHKHLSLADLEWLVFPPLMTGQFAVAEAKQKEGGSVPAAVVLWASVSSEVDKKLSENLQAPIKLRPDEWKSGNHLWLVEAVGDARVLPELLKQLSDKTFKGKKVKMRRRGHRNKPAA